MKTTIEQLAYFGGPEAFDKTLHVGHPNLPRRGRLFRRLDGILDRAWLTNRGCLVEQFESEICKRLGVAFCVSTSNGTRALEIAARTLDLKGDVIVPAFTFVATAHALAWLGLNPVFCDVDPETHSIDPASVESLITPRISAILGVHIWGQGCQVQALEEIAKRHQLPLFFDAAHAFMCSHNGRMIGGFGDLEILSFHATKILNTFEGGAVTTNSKWIADRVRLMTNFGFSGCDNVCSVGTNGKMPEVCAAMGLAGLEEIDSFIAANQRNHFIYRSRLSEVPGLRMLEPDDREFNNYHYVVLEIDPIATGMTRNELLRILQAENVLVRRYFYPGCHRLEPYASRLRDQIVHLPATECITERVLCLPNGSALDASEVNAISDVVVFAVKHGAEIAHRMKRLEPRPIRPTYGTDHPLSQTPMTSPRLQLLPTRRLSTTRSWPA